MNGHRRDDHLPFLIHPIHPIVVWKDADPDGHLSVLLSLSIFCLQMIQFPSTYHYCMYVQYLSYLLANATKMRGLITDFLTTDWSPIYVKEKTRLKEADRFHFLDALQWQWLGVVTCKWRLNTVMVILGGILNAIFVSFLGRLSIGFLEPLSN